ncbi:hypothetical protein AGMMS49545_07270 [Betaproteobacteria bacterium]|nr:hypothetical protein AGMMS49545_07270 [Betaproteobacteria bacterium]GHU46552.1 hypothetical protein AGMMS50289_20220 [Betaproteobacteria bacterium]
MGEPFGKNGKNGIVEAEDRRQKIEDRKISGVARRPLGSVGGIKGGFKVSRTEPTRRRGRRRSQADEFETRPDVISLTVSKGLAAYPLFLRRLRRR